MTAAALDQHDPGPVPEHTVPDTRVTDDDRLRVLLQRTQYALDVALAPEVNRSSEHAQLASALAELARVTGEVIVIVRRTTGAL